MSKIGKSLISTKQHPISKLKLFNFDALQSKDPFLSDRERSLLEKRTALQEWNHDYWCRNNSDFLKKKKEFIQSKLKNETEKDDLLNDANQSHEELAAFYKDFLDSNRDKHIAYNFEWYKRNVSLLWPSFIVAVESIFKRK